MSRNRKQLRGLIREANRAYQRAIEDGVIDNLEIMSMMDFFEDSAQLLRQSLTHQNPEQCYMGYTTALTFENDLSEKQIRKQAEKDGFDPDMVVFLAGMIQSDHPILVSNPRLEGRNLGYGTTNGSMARNQLRTIKRSAVELHDAIRDADELPDWVLSKITVAMDRVEVAKNYILSKLRGWEIESGNYKPNPWNDEDSSDDWDWD